MNPNKLTIDKNLVKLSHFTEKSFLILLILAIIWQCFPRVTSMAKTIENQEQTEEIIVEIQEVEFITPEEKIANFIKDIAEAEQFENHQLLIAIARSESRLNPLIRGEQDKRDRGLFQINSYYNPDVSDQCAFDIECSTRWTIKELKAGRAWKWNASRYGWGKHL